MSLLILFNGPLGFVPAPPPPPTPFAYAHPGMTVSAITGEVSTVEPNATTGIRKIG